MSELAAKYVCRISLTSDINLEIILSPPHAGHSDPNHIEIAVCLPSKGTRPSEEGSLLALMSTGEPFRGRAAGRTLNAG